MRRLKLALLGSFVALASVNAMACYTVTDSYGRVIFNGVDAPVDMSRQLHETMPYRFPGGSHMVFDNETSCPAANLVATRTPRNASATLNSPLLTDARTAEKMNVRHQMVASGVAVIPANQVAMQPAVMVVPAAVPPQTMMAGVPDTRSMGGPPAPQVRR